MDFLVVHVLFPPFNHKIYREWRMIFIRLYMISCTLTEMMLMRSSSHVFVLGEMILVHFCLLNVILCPSLFRSCRLYANLLKRQWFFFWACAELKLCEA